MGVQLADGALQGGEDGGLGEFFLGASQRGPSHFDLVPGTGELGDGDIVSCLDFVKSGFRDEFVLEQAFVAFELSIGLAQVCFGSGLAGNG